MHVQFEDERLMANELRKEVRILAKRELSDHSLDNEPLKALSRVLHATLAPVSVSASPSAEVIDYVSKRCAVFLTCMMLVLQEATYRNTVHCF